MREKTTIPALLAVLASWLAVMACHTIREELPTRPSATPAPLVPVAPIPAAPLPTPRPTASPGAPPGGDQDPLPATPPDNSTPSGSCSNPSPGAVSRIDVKVHIYGASRLILDATPLVGPDANYCKAIGYTDGRRYCPTRPEGDPERGACDAALVGTASDTGRIGPTWSANGKGCTGSGPSPYCENYPDNQFLVFAYGAGTYRACIRSGVCGSLVTNQ